MPCLGRVDWLISQVDMGRKCAFSGSSAATSGKFKVKVKLEAAISGAIDPFGALGVKCFLSSLRGLVNSLTAVDRGHRFSSGAAEICFWFSPSGGKAGGVSPLPTQQSSFSFVHLWTPQSQPGYL